MMSYINETDFVIENKELVYPEIVTDGLQLYYDAKGKRDTDYHRDTMLDMSGNKNHGKLHNFAYEKHSGYKDGLVFDYIDDKLVRPKLDLKPDDFTFMLNGNIISFSPDGTVKRVQDGEVIESKGFNMVRNGDFADGMNRWYKSTLADVRVTKGLATVRAGQRFGSFAHNLHSSSRMPSSGEKYYFCANIERHSSNVHLYLNDGRSQTYAIGPNIGFISNIMTLADNPTALLIKLQDNRAENWTESKMSNVMVINLTETFGAGKEPTKEQMDEIINRFGFIPNAQDLINRIEYQGNDLGDMENIIDGLYKTDVLSGQELFESQADDSVVHVEVDGKSYQHAGSGKNLFDIRHHRYSATITPNEWGGFDRSGGYGGIAGSEIKVEPNQTYTFSYKVEYGTARQEIYDGDGSILYILGTDTNVSFTPKHSTIRIDMSHYSGANYIDSRITEIQLEKGSVATEYEPPAPTPDYSIEIHSLNDFDVVSSVGKENLLLHSDKNLFTDGRYESVLLDEYLGVKNVIHIPKPSNTMVFSPAEKYVGTTMKKGKTYTLSLLFTYKGTKRYANPPVHLSYNSGHYKNLIGEVEEGKFNLLYQTYTPTEDVIPRLHIHLAEYGEVYISQFKFEEGDAPTPYTLAPEDILPDTPAPTIYKINLLLSEPLRSVGDIKDRLLRDSDGVWKIERRVGETIVGPTVNFAMGAPTGGWKVDGNTIPFYGYGEPSSNNQPSLTNKFKTSVGSWIVGSDLEGFSSGYRNFYIFRINKDRLDTVDSAGFKKWLEVNPVKVLYVLNTPITETLSQSLQDKLNNLRSFEDSNYVYTVDGSTNLLDTVPLLNNHWYPSSGTLQNPVTQNGHTSTQEPLPVYPGAKIHLTKKTTVDNYWRIVWVGKDNNVVIREVSTVNDLVLTAPNGAYGMKLSYPNGSNPVIKFDKSGITQTISNNLKPTLHAKFLYNNWYKEDRVINNLMIYNRALTNEEMLQNYKTIKRRWGM